VKYIFSDEYGTPSYKGIDRDENKVFFLSAVIVDPDDYSEFILGLTDFKVRWFKHKAEFCLHFKEISRKERIYRFLNSEHDEVSFHKDLLELISSLKFSFLGAFINKIEILHHFKQNIHPYLASIQLIAGKLLEFPEREFRWIFESRRSFEDRLYADSLENLTIMGVTTTHLDWLKDHRFGDLKFVTQFRRKEERIAGLEVADILAFAIGSSLRKEILEKPLWSFASRILEVIKKEKSLTGYLYAAI